MLLSRLHLFYSPYQTRQFIKYGIILVNDKKVDTNYILKKGGRGGGGQQDITRFKIQNLIVMPFRLPADLAYLIRACPDRAFLDRPLTSARRAGLPPSRRRIGRPLRGACGAPWAVPVKVHLARYLQE